MGTLGRIQDDQQDSTPVKGTQEWTEAHSGSNAPASTPVTAAPIKNAENQATQVASTGTSQQGDAVMGYDSQIELLKKEAAKYTPETDEQRKKREKREKSARIIAVVSDGIQALGNLYFTSQYAPSMYNHEKSSQQKANDARIEKAKAEREKNHDKYLKFSLSLGDAENKRAATLRELEAEQEKRKLAREKAEREVEAHGWAAALQPDKLREQAGKASKAEEDARTAKAEADNAPALQQAKLDTEKSRKGSYDASAANSRASAAAHGRSNISEFYAWDEKGKQHSFRTKAAADAYAKQHGTYKEEEVSTTTSTKYPEDGYRNNTRTTTKKNGYPSRPTPEDNTPPSRRNKDNTPPSRQ